MWRFCLIQRESPVVHDRPAVPHGVREKRARGGEERSEEPPTSEHRTRLGRIEVPCLGVLENHPAIFGLQRIFDSQEIERGRPARAVRGATRGSASTQASGEAASPGKSLSGPLFEAERSGAENIPVSGRERAGGFPGGGGVDQHRVGKN